MKQSINAFDSNTSPEVRAYIYQQLTDLEGLLPQGSNVSIVVDDPAMLGSSKNKGKKSKIFKKKVMIQLETEAGNLVVESEDLDVYKAINLAKENLRGQLSTLQNFLNDPKDRKEKIKNILSAKNLH